MEIEINEGNFEDEVVKSELPGMVDFWATWGCPCKMLAPGVAESAAEL